MATTFACLPPSTRPIGSAAPSPGRRGTPRGAGLPGPAGAHAGLWRQRLGLQSRSFPGRRVVAPRREVRRGDFDVIHVHEPLVPLVGWNAALELEGAGRRHLPHLLDQAPAQLPRQRARCPPPLQPPLGPDRRLRGGRLDRPPLVRRRLRDHPQRRRRRRRAERPPRRPPRSCGFSSSAAPRSARACRSCSPHSAPWSSTSPAG